MAREVPEILALFWISETNTWQPCQAALCSIPWWFPSRHSSRTMQFSPFSVSGRQTGSAVWLDLAFEVQVRTVGLQGDQKYLMTSNMPTHMQLYCISQLLSLFPTIDAFIPRTKKRIWQHWQPVWPGWRHIYYVRLQKSPCLWSKYAPIWSHS